MEIVIRGEEELMRALEKSTIQEPTKASINKIALWIHGHVMKSEPVVSGRLRSSITSTIGAFQAKIDTNVEYAPFVEFGHMSRGGTYVPPSRVAHGTSVRIRDIGAFEFAMRESNGKIGDWIKELGATIEQRFEQ